MSDLKIFYAVTSTSLYQAEIAGPGNTFLVKIACRSESRLRVGEKISNGTMISVGKHLILFIPEGSGRTPPTTIFEREISFEREINNVSDCYWGGHTSRVVALFMDEEKALQCHNAEDLRPCDPRWKKDTIATLRAIGETHPYCSITTFPPLWLLPPEEWQVT